MLSVAICDDVPEELARVGGLVEEYARAKAGHAFELCRFHSSEALCRRLNDGARFHIYLLDIIMPELGGIELGERIRAQDAQAAILYLTSSRDHALSSYSVGAAGYLLKPVEEEALFGALDRVIEAIDEENESSLVVKTRDGFRRLRYHMISHIEYINHGICCTLAGGEQVNSLTIRDSFDSITRRLLADGRFVRPHASFLVNLAQVSAIGQREFVMLTGDAVPISRKHFSAVKGRYFDYLLRGGEGRHVLAIGAALPDLRGDRGLSPGDDRTEV